MCLVIGAHGADQDRLVLDLFRLCSFSSPALEFIQLETEKRSHKIFETKGGLACMTGSYQTMP
jgi:hypothetical protein